MSIYKNIGIKNTSQQGSVLIMLVFLASVVAFFIIVANASIFSRDFNNTLDIRKKEYIEEAKNKLSAWYEKNAQIIDKYPNPITITEDQLFQESGLTRMYGAKIAITDIMYVPGTPTAYRRVAIWIPAFGVNDTSAFNASGYFIPSNTQTVYVVVDGQAIESRLVSLTQKTMSEAARILEQRFRAKFEADPSHNLRVNYFRSIDCTNVRAEEIPCTANLEFSGKVPINDARLKLWQLAGINNNLSTDSWGSTLYYDNSNLPALTADPPYSALIETTTPWGTKLILHAVQPIN